MNDIDKINQCKYCGNDDIHICGECGEEITLKQCVNYGGICFDCLQKEEFNMKFGKG